MNKAQKEVQQAQLDSEKKTIIQLRKIYGQARQDCEQKIRELSSRTDLENLQTIIYQKQYQEALKKQLDGILDDLQGKEISSVADYLTQSYENGYIGVMYDLHQQGIPVIMPINQERVVKALQTDSKLSKGLYSRLGEDVCSLKKSIRSELSRGIASGSTWNQIAGHIANGMNSPFNTAINNAIRIARTEGHRIQQRSALDSQYAAKEHGADILKQWDSTLDSLTRPHHRRLDGQIRELNEPFEVDGMKADAPGHFGKPKEDCNCRCCLLQRARWALDEEELQTLKDRAAYFGLEKTADFADFKKKYLVATEKLVTKDLASGIIETGARIIDPDSIEAIKFAEMYYEEIRSFSTDAEKIAKNLEKEVSDIKRIKAYLFEDDSLFDPDIDAARRFDPDCAIAQSWQRLMIGKDIKPHDRTLIEHELLEMKIKRDNPGIEHRRAHELASQEYNYGREAAEYYGNLKKHKKSGI